MTNDVLSAVVRSNWAKTGNDISYTSGRVGIGTGAPTEQLHIFENINNGWAGRGVFGNANLNFVCGVHDNHVMIAGHKPVTLGKNDLGL